MITYGEDKQPEVSEKAVNTVFQLNKKLIRVFLYAKKPAQDENGEFDFPEPDQEDMTVNTVTDYLPRIGEMILINGSNCRYRVFEVFHTQIIHEGVPTMGSGVMAYKEWQDPNEHFA